MVYIAARRQKHGQFTIIIAQLQWYTMILDRYSPKHKSGTVNKMCVVLIYSIFASCQS